MVSYCCVKGCGNNSKNKKKKDPNSVISFHGFPSNPELKKKWLRAIGRPNWEPPTYSRVCSAHFNYDQINYDGSRIRVKDEACPVNSLPPNSNFEASNVEACRICLATDTNMYSLQNTHLGACMETVAGFSKNLKIDGMPQYICYPCAPNLIKCNKLIEKCMISQATLLDIFAKNGQITKDLIIEQSSVELNLESPLNDNSLLNDYVSFEYDDIDNISHFITSKPDSDEVNNVIEHYEDDTKTETDMKDIQNEKCENEANDNEMGEINNVINNDDDVPEAKEVPDKDLKEKLNLIVETQEKEVVQIKHIKKKPVKQKANSLTQIEKSMLKYFNIVKLSLHEQFEEWQKRIRRRHLVNETVYPCEICGKLFENVNSHRAHVTNHDPSHGPAECAVCKLRFKSPAFKNYHTRRTHSNKFYCKMCPKTFNIVGEAKRHQRWHSGYRYKCNVCTFSTLHEPSLRAHKRNAHVHACSACGRTYISARGLHVHTQFVHNVIDIETEILEEHRCEDCDISFTSEGARRVHILTSSQHRTKLDSCNATAQENIRNCCKRCGVEFSTFKDLVLHSRVEHPRPGRSQQQCRGDTAYPICCELCGETISSPKAHWNHVRRHHPKDIDTYQSVITAVCDICGKGFQNKTKLYLHQLRHRSPTVHCPSCPQLFYDKYALARHARLHDDLRPHQCRTCGRAFKRLNYLEKHSRVHTNIFPYECTKCGKKYKYSSSLKLHFRKVH